MNTNGTSSIWKKAISNTSTGLPFPRTLDGFIMALLLAGLGLCFLVPRAIAAPVQGYIDAHSHMMSYEAFGGRILCGKPFDPAGIDQALVDCLDHYPNGEAAWFENFVRTGSPVGTHSPVGWPTFEDWPAYDSLTHQQMYYEWVERAWRGGQRILVNQLVANRQLCEMYPLKKYACDEMASIRRQAQRVIELQNHIDYLSGGPGTGWFRVVYSPAEARSVINDGKLAVILGVEASEPFGCRKTLLGLPLCTRSQINAGLDELYALGVRSLFLCHKFDNALCGVRFDPGFAGMILNVGNFLSSTSFWQAQTCTAAAHDNTIEVNGVLPGPIAGLLPLGISLPLYPPAPHCNRHGLTNLGKYALQGMMARGMLAEIDHMSVKATDETLDLLEAAQYSGVISAHDWVDPSFYSRIYQLGGFVTRYGSSANGFVVSWESTKPLRQAAGAYGYGYGLDANGLGAQVAPRPDNANNPVIYPFVGWEGVPFDRQHTGQRIWDFNTEGMANYGMVPDWIEDLRIVGGNEIIDEMAAGAESYLQTWEAAQTP